MLRADVVAATDEGKFQVHAVRTIDQAIELLTGVPAGERTPVRRFRGTARSTARRRAPARVLGDPAGVRRHSRPAQADGGGAATAALMFEARR